MEPNLPPQPVDVTMDTFEELVDTHPFVILDFWAEWCQPCRVFAPAFAAMAEHYPQVVFGKVNVETARELAEAFQVKSVPTIMAFRRGELVFEQPGVPPVEQFERLIQTLQN